MSQSPSPAHTPAKPLRVAADGSVRLPAALRRSLAIREGSKFIAVANGRTVVLVPAVTPMDLYGTAAGADTSDYRDHDD